MKRKKVTQSDIQSYLDLIEGSCLPGFSVSRALQRQGFTPFEIAKYLRTNGTDEESIITILRELNNEPQ